MNGLSREEIQHLHVLKKIRATLAEPAFGVDRGALKTPTLTILVGKGLVGSALLRRYGVGKERTGYWLTEAGANLLAGRSEATITDGDAVPGAEGDRRDEP